MDNDERRKKKRTTTIEDRGCTDQSERPKRTEADVADACDWLADTAGFDVVRRRSEIGLRFGKFSDGLI